MLCERYGKIDTIFHSVAKTFVWWPFTFSNNFTWTKDVFLISHSEREVEMEMEVERPIKFFNPLVLFFINEKFLKAANPEYL